MKAMLAFALALFTLGSAYCAQFSIPDGGVTFDAPDGFTQLTSEEIARKFPRSSPPGFVVGNERRTTTIAFDLKPQSIPGDKLGEVKSSFEQLFQRMIPGLVWKERKVISMQDQQWIYLELTSHAVDTDIHNIVLVTPHKDKALIFNFNSTKSEFPKVEAKLRESLRSIRLK